MDAFNLWICGLELRDETRTATAVYEEIPGVRGAASPEAAVDDSRGSQTSEHVGQEAQEPGGASRRPVTDLQAEMSRLKRDLAEARMECDRPRP